MQLAVKAIEHVEEVEPATFELVVTLEQGTLAAVRMDATTLRSLLLQIVVHGIS